MNIKITIANDRNQIPIVSQTVRNLCSMTESAEPAALNKIELAVVELLTNIFDYGNLEVESEVIVQCRFKDDVFTVDIADNGKPLSAEQAQMYTDDEVCMPMLDAGIDFLPVNGWGVQLIKSACDRISYERADQTNQFSMEFDFSLEVS